MLAPSILAADLADLVHVDVMDGHFVPNLTFGIPVLEALTRRCRLPMDVHLMVSNPAALLDEYIDAGAGWITVHWEVTDHLDRVLGHLRDRGVKAGVALNPATPVELLADVLDALDYVLLMSVNPGFAGQRFLPHVLDKARRLRRLAADRDTGLLIEMDGGIGERNIGEVVAAGVDICVAGSAVYGTEDPVETLGRLRRKIDE